MKRLNCILPIALAFVLSSSQPAFAGADSPAVWPTCPSPQNAAPVRPPGGTTGTFANAIAWNGQEFGLIWPLNASPYTLMFRRIYADGTPASPAVQVGVRQAQNSPPPTIVWTGSEYGIAWIAGGDFGYWQLYFTRIDRNGTPLMSPIKVSFATTTETSNVSYSGMAWSGSGYALIWRDDRNGGANSDIFATLLTASGAIAGGGALHDIAISTDAGNQTEPAIAWSPSGNGYVAAWGDYGVSAFGEIRARTLSTGGATGSVNTVVNGAARYPSETALTAGASGFGLAWAEQRDGNIEIYFTRLTALGAEIGADTRMTNSLGISSRPALVWTGAEYLLAWDDNRGGAPEIWLQRVSGDGALLGANAQITSSGGLYQPGVAFANRGLMLIAQDSVVGGLFTIPASCQADATPPACSGGYAAWSITGTTATVGWLPASDGESDIAYYNVYRNSQWVGSTSSTYFNDSGLSPSGNYAYAVQPVNAMQLQNTACTATINVKTNSSLTLTMSKASADDAGLSWTDAGFNDYNLWRGTDPRVMNSIGSTPALSSTDPNVLPSPVSYFYSVDNPGP